jgi:hypothetical protein
MKQKREEFKLNSHEINTQRSENLNNIESSPSHSNLKSESDINELHTDLTKNKLINETVNSKDIKLEHKECLEKITEDSCDKRESKRISIRIPGRKARKSIKIQQEAGNNI